MITQISGIGPGQSVVTQVNATATQGAVGAVRPDASGFPQNEAARDTRESTSTQVAGAYAQLRARQEDLNNAASVVREVGNKVGQATQLLDKIENSMGEIVKMYPPYPIDNPQRITLLNNIGGLRKQIDDLTFPPPDSVDAVGRLLDGKVDENGKVGDTVAKKDFFAAIKEQKWDIPALDPLSASDVEVGKALDQVKAMKSSLESFKDGMWNDVVSFVNAAQSSETQNEAAGVRDRLAELGGGRGIGGSARLLEKVVESK